MPRTNVPEKLQLDMTKSKKTVLICMWVVLTTQSVFAQPKIEEEAVTETVQSGEHDAATLRENPSSAVPYESGRDDESTCEDRWSNFLPILGQAACEKGFVLPRPFGLSVGYMHQDQPFDVGSIFVNGIDVQPPGGKVIDEVQNEETTYTLRVDAWILPFWNVYGVVGRTEGQAVGPPIGDLEPVFPIICVLPGNYCDSDANFELNYKADVRGYGTTIAGGYKDFFGMIDANWTNSDLDISTTDAKATVISSRIGWNGKIGFFTGVLWVGAMYQDVSQTLDLPFAVGASTVLVSIDQSTQQAYNYMVGGQWDINRSFSVLAELGLGDRKSQMLNVTYRF